MADESTWFYALYLAGFAGGFGFVTLATRLPKYVIVLQASGFMAGPFYAAVTVSQTAVVIPLA